MLYVNIYIYLFFPCHRIERIELRIRYNKYMPDINITYARRIYVEYIEKRHIMHLLCRSKTCNRPERNAIFITAAVRGM